MMRDIALTQWVVYRNPADAPGMFVVRQWMIEHGKLDPIPGQAWASESLEALRTVLPNGLVRFEPGPDDDPCIVEVWT